MTLRYTYGYFQYYTLTSLLTINSQGNIPVSVNKTKQQNFY